MIRVPDSPRGRLTGAGSHRAGTGRLDLTPRRDHQDLPAPAGEGLVRRSSVEEEHGTSYTVSRDTGGLRSPKPGRIDVLYEAAEPTRTHRRPAARDGRVDLPLTSRHEVTPAEPTSVHDEAPPRWWDERRLLGRKATA
ncbi:hypothetical protein [Streptomyces sp. NPDC093598]|uniref:hypothetical protein n=1 Tax=Streptomyces sp. NPDC093598 TaxID=3366046 RepID=UPI0037F61FF0